MTTSVLAGFVRIEEEGDRDRKRRSSGSTQPQQQQQQQQAAQTRSRARVCSRWLYGVLKGDRLRLYWRRTDYKRRVAPLDELVLQMRAGADSESAFGFDHECIYVRAKDSGRLLSVRIHQKKEIVRWVTALYYQSLGGEPAKESAVEHGEVGVDATRAASRVGDTTPSPRAKRKSVSFQDEPQVMVLPRQSYDPDDLYYSEVDYEHFLRQRKSHLSSLMQAIYSKTAAKLKVSSKKQQLR